MTEQIKDIQRLFGYFLKRKKFFIIPFVVLFIMVSCDCGFIARHL